MAGLLAANIETMAAHMLDYISITYLRACQRQTTIDQEALKAEIGLDLWLVGGGKLAHALLPEIDRLVIKQTGSVIGSGIPLFDGPFQHHLFKPTDETLLPSGVRVLTYDRT